jgi:hypothetical protein
MAYKILHMPTGTYVYNCMLTHPSVCFPALLFELVDNPDRDEPSRENFMVYTLDTKYKAEQCLKVLFDVIKTHRALYKERPDLYASALDRRFYTILKTK